MYTDLELEAFDLTRCVLSMANGTLARTLEGELLAAAAERSGKELTNNMVTIPWSLLTKRSTGTVGQDSDWAAFQAMQRRALSRRDLTAAADPEIIPSRELPALDALRGHSILVQAGATVLQGKGNISLPELTAGTVSHWLTDETTAADTSRPTFRALDARPHTTASVCEYSHLFKSASAQGEQVIARNLLRSVGRAIDSAAIVGTGADGQPLGLLNNTDIETITAASDYPGAVIDAMGAVEGSGAIPSGFIVGSTIAKTLRGTARMTGTGPVLDAGRIEGLPAYVTSAAPSALVVGDLADLSVILFGDGIQLLVNPYQDFERGLIAMRALAHVDIIPRRAESFAKIA